MKKIALYIATALALLTACEPVVDQTSIGSVPSVNELQLDIRQTTAGGNQIVFSNNTPRVGSYWNYGFGISVKQQDTILVPFLGEVTLSFTGLGDGGTVTTSTKISVGKIDHRLAPEWALFAGTTIAGKTWVWDDDPDLSPYGAGDYRSSTLPDWEKSAIGDDGIDAGDEMVFDLNGGANFTRKLADGTVEKGSFSFDTTKGKNNAKGKVWSIGEITFTGTTILNGHYVEKTDPVYKFDIVSLTADRMVLANSTDESEATFWVFKAKE